MTKLRGCIPILCTPFFDDGALDLESLKREIEFVLAEGASGVAALAIASEGYKLTESERDLVTQTVVGATAHRVPVVISADGTGTEVAIDRAKRAAEIGADALMVLPPYFVKPEAASLFDYYKRVAEAVQLPIMIQAAPQLTGVAMGPELWARLADQFANVRYVKSEGTPQGATITETVRRGQGKLAVFTGWGGLGAIDGFERGAIGTMPAPNFTRLFAEIQQLFEAGDHVAASEKFKGHLPYVLWAMQSIDFSVAAAKAELVRRGVFASAHQRQPAVELDEIAKSQLSRWIVEVCATPSV